MSDTKFFDALLASNVTLPDTTTENGAGAFTSTKVEGIVSPVQPELVDFYYKTVRGCDREMIRKLFRDALNANPLGATKLLFQTRDCRKNNPGKGERKIFHNCVLNLDSKTLFANINAGNFERYGYFKDLVILLGDATKEVANEIVSYLTKILTDDWNNLHPTDEKSVKGVSLLAKWMPSEGGSFHKKHKHEYLTLRNSIVASIAPKSTNIKKDYRKILSTLRKHLDIVEIKICKGDWEHIDFSKVPALAMKVYLKTFQRHCREMLNNFLEKVQTGDAKINAGVLFPSDVIPRFWKENIDSTVETALTEQWKEMTKKFGGLLGKSVSLIDVSGSMNGVPMDNAISLGLLVAENSSDAFKNRFITFSTKPVLFDLTKTTSLKEKVRAIRSSPWGGNTDFSAAHDLILRQAVENNVPQESFPDRFFVFSDMQFDVADHSYNASTHDILRKRYKDAGYKFPTMIYWNLSGKYNNVPAKSTYENVIMISGFSPNVLTEILNGNISTPEKFVASLIDHKAYEPVVYCGA
jgi:hypothetical protein